MELELDLLNAWMNMSENIKANRILNDLSMNEMFICNYLYINGKASAKQLIDKTKLLKSQINRHINNMLKKEYITRILDPKDRRKIEIRLTEKGRNAYLKEHKAIIGLMNYIIEKLGKDKAALLTEYMIDAVKTLKEYGY